MRRLLPIFFSLFVIALVVFMVHRDNEKRRQLKRETAYQATLRSYQEFLKPGMTRKEVQDQLRTRNPSFRQMCCADFNESSFRRSWDDLVKIADEDPPFACGENSVYVAIQFVDYNPNKESGKTDDLDTVKAVILHHQLEKCL
jgi:hypothetical protein